VARKPPSASGGRASSGAAASVPLLTALNPQGKDAILLGRGGSCETYLIWCAKGNPGPSLSRNQELMICDGLWMKVTDTPNGDTPPPMPAAFKRRLVTESIAGSPRMGIKLWWSNEGVQHRADSCKHEKRCGVYVRGDKVNTGAMVKCVHCNAAYHRQLCPCTYCVADRAQLARAR
jgi:hypothetical protein